MSKKAFYTLLAIIVIILLASMSAICSIQDASGTNTSSTSGSDSSNSSSQSSSNSGQSQPDQSNSSNSSQNSGDSQQSSGNGNQQSDGDSQDNIPDGQQGNNDDNRPPEIISININSNDLFTGLQYTITADVSDPDNDMLIYSWSTDGGSLDNPSAETVVWTTPMFPETYHIILNISDGFGGTDSHTIPVRVEIDESLGEAPIVSDIIINESPIYTGRKYYVYVEATDPDNDLDYFQFISTGGTFSDLSANTGYWETPSDPGTYSITINVYDVAGNIGSLTKDFTIRTK